MIGTYLWRCVACPYNTVAGPRVLVLGIIQLRDLDLPKIWGLRIIVRPRTE